MKIESIVIVGNKYGRTATLRFSDPTKDRILFNSDREKLYKVISKVVHDAIPSLQGPESPASDGA